jgi:hypothetical protein
MGRVDAVRVIAYNLLLDIQARRSTLNPVQLDGSCRQEQMGTCRILFQPRDWAARATEQHMECFRLEVARCIEAWQQPRRFWINCENYVIAISFRSPRLYSF